MQKRPIRLLRYIAWIAILAVIISACSAPNTRQAPLQTVSHVDLNRYLGKWYEIAKIPNRFQRHCAGDTTAEYRRLEKNRIGVTNRCRDQQGNFDQAHGIARVVDHKTKAKLKVSFVSILGVSLFWGDYWIIGLGENYEYAVVGTPNRKYGWILSRNRSLSRSTREKIRRLLVRSGYDPLRFEDTKHTVNEN